MPRHAPLTAAILLALPLDKVKQSSLHFLVNVFIKKANKAFIKHWLVLSNKVAKRIRKSL